MTAIVPLHALKPGEVARVVDVCGSDSFVNALAERGLHRGCRLRLLAGGPTALCQIGDCRLCFRACDGVQVFVERDG